MPYVEENGKHFGGLRWASGTEGNCFQVEISPPVSRSGEALSTVLYSGGVWLEGIHGRHVKSSIPSQSTMEGEVLRMGRIAIWTMK
jgi:hypothetical protein